MWKCKHCNNEFDFTKCFDMANHSRWCDKNPKHIEYKNNSNAINAMNASKRQSGFVNKYTKAKILGVVLPKIKIKRTKKTIKHSDVSKKKMSEKRKKYLKENPDKHPWKNNNKFISIPCEKFKEELVKNNILFLQEYTDPLWDHSYAIDIAFPDIKVAIEINGNQHYNSDKTLKPYYQKKHDYLTNLGWIIHEVHYACVFKKEIVKDLIVLIKTLLDNLDSNI